MAKKEMTKKELSDWSIRRLEREASTGWEEDDHLNADKILCDLLRRLGYEEVVDLWEQVEKWYY
jgi:hypothetical protein